MTRHLHFWWTPINRWKNDCKAKSNRIKISTAKKKDFTSLGKNCFVCVFFLQSYTNLFFSSGPTSPIENHSCLLSWVDTIPFKIFWLWNFSFSNSCAMLCALIKLSQTFIITDYTASEISSWCTDIH